jgi:hypothetical protein
LGATYYYDQTKANKDNMFIRIEDLWQEDVDSDDEDKEPGPKGNPDGHWQPATAPATAAKANQIRRECIVRTQGDEDHQDPKEKHPEVNTEGFHNQTRASKSRRPDQLGQ